LNYLPFYVSKAMDQLIHKVLYDRYRIQSILGRQTGRRTFLASDLQTELSVVVKLLLFSPDFAWDDLKLFEREAETLKSLDHPAIPRYLDCFEIETELGQGFALVQSFMEARSLQNWIHSGRTFSEQELKAIAKELLGILMYLHDRQPPVIHRDIKPSNILLGDRSGNSVGQVYLIDFGSVQTAVQSGTRTVVGTYGYMPPEQFGGRSLPASDLYSLGATLVYLITGQHPADLLQDDLHIDLNVAVQRNCELIPWLEQLIEPKLNQRFKTAAEALQSLEQPPNPLTSQIQTRCSKYLITNTTEIFHWRVSTASKLLDAIEIGYRWAGGGSMRTYHTHLFLILYILFSIAMYCALLFWFLSAVRAGNPWAIGFSILLAIGGVGGLLDRNLLAEKIKRLVEPFAETHFTIDRTRIQIDHYFLGKSWQTLNVQRSQIQRVCLTPRYFRPYASSEGGDVVYATEIQASLEIWFNHQKFSIPGTCRLNDCELAWLAQELSNFLSVELQTMPAQEISV
jgi:serine/threonine protein kinase